jgi:Uma2 family endonuclease
MAYSPATRDNAAELTWELAQLAPNRGAGLSLPPDQGHWSEEEYLSLDTNRLIEYSHGQLEVLPMPTFSHQRLVAFLYRSLMGFIEERGLGVVMFAPLRIQLWSGKYREPDLVFMATEHADRLGEQYWRGADLVMEIVSPDDPQRDTVTKRREYAQAGIPEYWIVNPIDDTVTVLVLGDGEYREHGVFRPGAHADSPSLPDVSISVRDTFEAALPRHHDASS